MSSRRTAFPGKPQWPLVRRALPYSGGTAPDLHRLPCSLRWQGTHSERWGSYTQKAGARLGKREEIFPASRSGRWREGENRFLGSRSQDEAPGHGGVSEGDGLREALFNKGETLS